ncbi:hypothetical protein BN8_05188 [Fibrisoma limi BUZ 3]|uniref:Gliding motility-associated C-terminal domain-containing protein n=1 Tax=Fibrisoma limi BUZ 3 TaxID=1185876 RepID=I2GPR3_9BACT|nr:gliding motility-associated C-terminal domain-containing protein [Fibrisoma limi]CCH55891.1 hypothetical protein BN8_05188 [Fibrisoma limi BUZ 3]
MLRLLLAQLLMGLAISVSSAQTIKVASIHHSRLDAGSDDKGYTLNGATMIKTALPKLTNTANFGPGGKVPYSLSITHTFTASGSITATSLAPFDILFIGPTFGGSFPVTQAEQIAIKAWSAQPGKVVILAEQPANYPVTAYYGYTLREGNTDPTTVRPGDSVTKLFTGVFGEATSMTQGGTSQGYFSTDCFSTVIATNADDKPTIIFASATRDVLIADTDFFTIVGNTMSEGPVIDPTNDTDKFWGNLWAWAVNEVVKPGAVSNPVAASVTPACSGTNGTITFTSPVGNTSDGQAYQYSINGSTYQTNPTFTNVPTGTYTISSRTSSACPVTSGGTVTVKGPPDAPGLGALIQPGCGATTGTISLTGLPASGNYVLTRTPGGLIPSATSGTTYTDKEVGQGGYSYMVTNADGCSSPASALINIVASQAPQILRVQLQLPSCGKANGEVIVTARGEGSLTYSLDGINFSSQPVFKNLTPAKYLLTVRDANSCSSTQALELIQPPLPSIAAVNVVVTSCGGANGAISLTVTGGVKPLGYSLDSTTFQPNGSFTNLRSGTYRAIVKDSVGCTSGVTIPIAPSQSPTIDSVRTSQTACGEQTGELTMYARAASAMMYSLDSVYFQNQPFFARLKADRYAVYVKDALGCITKTMAQVEEDCSASVSMPSAFSPNQDGLNNNWTIHFRPARVTIMNLTIFNRWGEVVYNRKEFELSSGDPLWDGTINGQIAPAGVFAYHLDVQFDPQRLSRYSGTVQLIR